VSDLYLPPPSGESTPTAVQRAEAERVAKQVAEHFSGLYADPSLDDKARLQETMKAIVDAYGVLRLQWSALGQSPDHGVALLRKLKARCPEVPFVFYSRKITPEDVIRVLQAGAVDAIRKGALKDEEVLARLATADAWDRSHATTFAVLPPGSAHPEGITTDSKGNFYVVTWDYDHPAHLGHLIVFSRDGRFQRRVEIAGASSRLRRYQLSTRHGRPVGR